MIIYEMASIVMKILIIGGTRFIGAHLTRELLEQGHDVVHLNRGKQRPFFIFDIETIQCDKRDIATKRAEIESRHFDLVIDMKAMSIADTQPVLTLLDGTVDRICVISSADVYRVTDVVWKLDPTPIDNTELSEDSPLRRRLFNRNLTYKGEDLYEMYDKIPVEYRVRDIKHSSWTICRLPAVYGSGDYRFKDFSKRYGDRRTRWVMEESYAHFRFTHGYVEDVAKAIVLAATHEKGRDETFNIGELNTPSYCERYKQMASDFGLSLELYKAKRSEMTWIDGDDPFNLNQHWILNSDKIRTQLGFQETYTLEEAYRKTVEWEIRNPPDKIDPKEFNYEAEDAFIESLS